MPGNCAIFRSWSTGESLTAADLTTSFTTVGVTNMTMQCLDDYSVDVTQMRLAIDPGEVGSESLATSSAGEIERLRFAIKDIKGTTQWYETRPAVTHSLATTAGDILVSTGANAFARLGIGADDTVLSVEDEEILWLPKTPTPLYISGIYGLTLSNNSLDSVNDLDIAAGATISDDSILTARINMNLATSFVKQLDAEWTVGSGNGMRDSGTNLTGAKTFHIFIIQRTDTNVVDIFASTLLSPTLPTGYTKKRRIGSILWTGSTILQFVQLGNEFLLKTPQLDVNHSNPGTGDHLGTLSVPANLNVEWRGIVLVEIGSVGATIYLTHPGVNDTIPIMYTETIASPGHMLAANVGSTNVATQAFIYTNTSSQIRYRLKGGDASVKAALITLGWCDYGRY